MGKFKIGRIITVKNPILKYEIVVTYMHGDADKYEKEILYNSDETLVLKFFDAINEIINDNKARRDRNACAKKYPMFFDEDFIHEETDEQIFLQWPGDCTCNSMYAAAITHCEIFYFDENGIKHEVEYVDE